MSRPVVRPLWPSKPVDTGRPIRREPAVRLFLVTCCLLAAVGCAGPSRPTPSESERPRATRGYVLISLDTLRADHLGCYGYERDTSPFLDSLAQRAVLFENAIVQYPSTLTSHMSIFTGLYPAEHGVYPPDSVLSEGIETLPEAFQKHGFRTAGVTEGGYVHGRFGFRRGFDLFLARDRQGSGGVHRTFERGRQFLRDLGPEEPFFLFLHTYAVHAPYDPPDDYRRLFWEGEPPSGAFPPTGPELSRLNALGEVLSPEVRDYFEALYDAEIRQLDDVLKRFFSELEDLGLRDDTTVVITSDHGEEFQEHGRVNHTQLYREVLNVPLLVVHPDFTGGRRYAPPVRSVDLAPTLYELARIESAAELSGRSLVSTFPRTAGPADEATAEAFAEVAGEVRSLVRYDAGELLHLLVFQPDPLRWWTRRLRIEVADEAPIDFEIRSFREERTIEIYSGETLVHSSTIGPQWTRLKLDLPDRPRRAEGAPHPDRHSLVLTSPDCTIAEEVENLKKVRCFSFQVRGIALSRAELYDVAADPAEASDLAAEQAADVRSLYARLAEYESRKKAEARSEELDEKLRAELEALGYLQ